MFVMQPTDVERIERREWPMKLNGRRTEIRRPWRTRIAVLAVAIIFCCVCAGAVRAQSSSASIALPSTPGQTVVDPVTNTVYAITGSTISVVDVATNSVISISDPSSSAPIVIGLDPSLNRIFSVDGVSGNLSIFSGPTATSPAAFLKTVTVSGATNPVAIVVNPQTHLVYVAYGGSSNLGVFDGAGETFQAFVTLDAAPLALGVNPATNMIYVAKISNIVSQINGANNSIAAVFPTGTLPVSLAVNSATNFVYTANQTSNDFTAINVGAASVSTQTAGCTSPSAIAVSPATNQIYIACSGNSSVAVISGATNTGVAHAVQSGGGSGAAIAVDSATNIAYAQIGAGAVTAINGTTQFVTNISTGAGEDSDIAVNPASHKVYASISGGLAVVDGANFATNRVPTSESQAVAVAVNSATNKIYVANSGSNNVTVIDGATNTVTDTVTVGTAPQAIAVDPIRNQIYVANSGSNFVTVIDGATDQTAPVTDVSAVNAVALDVNPVNNLVYVANKTSNNMTVFSTIFNQSTGVTDIGMPAGGTSPSAIAVNPASGQVFVATPGNSGMTIFDGVQYNSFTFGTCSDPVSVAVNPVTNIAYVACNADGNILEIAGGAGTTPGTQTTLNNSPTGTGPIAVAVNPITNKIYVANNGSNNVTVIDGTTNTMSTVGAGSKPVAIAVNVATNKIYVVNQADSTVTVIDGATNSANTIATGSGPNGLAINPAQGTIYVADQTANDVTQITEFPVNANGLVTAITALSGNSTPLATPTFTFSPTNSLTTAPVNHVYFQVDSQQGTWAQATGSGTFTGTTGVLSAGVHVLYAYATAGDEAGSAATGTQNAAVIGTIAAYPFLVAPAIAANVSPFAAVFGNVEEGVQSAPQTITLINEGAAPLSFSYAFSGPNAADFFDGPGGSCAGLGGVLAPLASCTVNAVFLPATFGAESATITFTDNSGGVAGTQQSEPLTGTGEANLNVTVGGSGSGTVKDNFSQITCTNSAPCNALYAGGTTVNLTATPNPGSTFQSWSGACTGNGACGVVMDSDQTVTANFSSSTVATCAPTDDVWVGGAAGNWSNSSNWSSGVPNSGSTNVCINNGVTPASHVTLDTTANVGNLTINPGNILTMGDNTQLFVAGTIANSGLIQLVTAGNNTVLTINGAVKLQGGGTLTMTEGTSGGAAVINQENSGTLTNVDNIIQGAGQIGNNGLVLTNQAVGIINANSTKPLLINSNSVTNQGLMEATAGGTLQINTTVVNAGATISSLGSGSNVQFFNGADIEGGTFNTSGGGVLGAANGNNLTLDGASHGAITNAGVLSAPDNTDTFVSGTMNNTGSIQMTTAGNNIVILVMNGPVTLQGGGTLTMTEGTTGGTTVINQENSGSLTNVNNLIQGSGQIGNNGLVLTNELRA